MYYRHISEGGWPFSTSAHGWPISDCSAEGLKGVLCLLHSQAVKEGVNNNKLAGIDEQRLEKAVNVIVTYQNEDGGEQVFVFLLWIATVFPCSIFRLFDIRLGYIRKQPRIRLVRVVESL